MKFKITRSQFLEGLKTVQNVVPSKGALQIIQNIRERLAEISEEKGVQFEILEQNCNLDASVRQQIIENYIADEVDLLVGVATPVAQTMQGMTEESNIPVVFAAVSDPVGAGLVESLEAPGANITGTSDYLNTNAILDLIFAANPDAKKIALLYNPSEDASTAPIVTAKEVRPGGQGGRSKGIHRFQSFRSDAGGGRHRGGRNGRGVYAYRQYDHGGGAVHL